MAVWDRWTGIGVGGLTIGGPDVLPIVIDSWRSDIRNIWDVIVRLGLGGTWSASMKADSMV